MRGGKREFSGGGGGGGGHRKKAKWFNHKGVRSMTMYEFHEFMKKCFFATQKSTERFTRDERMTRNRSGGLMTDSGVCLTFYAMRRAWVERFRMERRVS